MPDAWTREEVELIVADYRAMLLARLRGERYSKAESGGHCADFWLSIKYLKSSPQVSNLNKPHELVTSTSCKLFYVMRDVSYVPNVQQVIGSGYGVLARLYIPYTLGCYIKFLHQCIWAGHSESPPITILPLMWYMGRH